MQHSICDNKALKLSHKKSAGALPPGVSFQLFPQPTRQCNCSSPASVRQSQALLNVNFKFCIGTNRIDDLMWGCDLLLPDCRYVHQMMAGLFAWKVSLWSEEEFQNACTIRGLVKTATVCYRQFASLGSHSVRLLKSIETQCDVKAYFSDLIDLQQRHLCFMGINKETVEMASNSFLRQIQPDVRLLVKTSGDQWGQLHQPRVSDVTNQTWFTNHHQMRHYASICGIYDSSQVHSIANVKFKCAN